MPRVIAALMAVASCASVAQAQTATSPSQAATEPPFTLERALALGGAVSRSLAAVTTGQRSAGRIEIVSGVAAGQSIATKNAFLLKAELGKGAGEEE